MTSFTNSFYFQMSNGHFRYDLSSMKSRQVGKFVAQLNPMRATSRRQPQSMLSVRQKFDQQKFNFNKGKIFGRISIKSVGFDVKVAASSTTGPDLQYSKMYSSWDLVYFDLDCRCQKCLDLSLKELQDLVLEEEFDCIYLSEDERQYKIQ